MHSLRILLLLLFVAFPAFASAVKWEQDKGHKLATSSSLSWSTFLRNFKHGPKPDYGYVVLNVEYEGKMLSHLINLNERSGIAMSAWPDKIVTATSSSAWILTDRRRMVAKVSLPDATFERGYAGDSAAISPNGKHVFLAYSYGYKELSLLMVNDMCVFPLLKNGFIEYVSGPRDARERSPYAYLPEGETTYTSLMSRVHWVSDTKVECVLVRRLNPRKANDYRDEVDEGPYIYTLFTACWPDAEKVGQLSLTKITKREISEKEAFAKSTEIEKSLNQIENGV